MSSPSPARRETKNLLTDHWTFFKRHLCGVSVDLTVDSGAGGDPVHSCQGAATSNIHWALHPPICQCKGCYHKKKVEEEHWQPHRWKREAISEQLCWQIWVTGLRYTIPPKTPVSSHICSNSLGTPPSHMSKQGMLAQKESRRRTLTAPLLKERCD